MNNNLYLRRRRKVCVEAGTNELAPNYVAAILKNIESLGFAFSEELIARLNTLSVEQLSAFYTQLQPYCDLPECFAGWMSRAHAASGEVFEPRTVHDRIDLASDTRISIPAIIDFADKQIVWTDIALKKSPLWNNVQQNLRGVSLMLKALTSLVKPNLFDLFMLHVNARGELVDKLEDANTVFSIENGVTPFDLELIASEYM